MICIERNLCYIYVVIKRKWWTGFIYSKGSKLMFESFKYIATWTDNINFIFRSFPRLGLIFIFIIFIYHILICIETNVWYIYVVIKRKWRTGSMYSQGLKLILKSLKYIPTRTDNINIIFRILPILGLIYRWIQSNLNMNSHLSSENVILWFWIPKLYFFVSDGLLSCSV